MTNKKTTLTLWLVFGILVLAFLVVCVAVAVVGGQALPVDQAIANWTYDVRGEKGGFGFWFFRITTELGYTWFVLALIVVLAIVWKLRSKVWFFAGTVLVSYILQNVVKAIVQRARPDSMMWWVNESSTSFPSGHSITATCVFVLLFFFVCTLPKTKKWVKWLVGCLSMVAIVLVPLSRIMLGVHYFSDVLAGVFMGGAVACLGILAYRFFCTKHPKMQKCVVNAPTIDQNQVGDIHISTSTNNKNIADKNSKCSAVDLTFQGDELRTSNKGQKVPPQKSANKSVATTKVSTKSKVSKQKNKTTTTQKSKQTKQSKQEKK